MNGVKYGKLELILLAFAALDLSGKRVDLGCVGWLADKLYLCQPISLPAAVAESQSQ